MSRTLQDVLDNELSPDNLGNYTPDELAKYLIEIGVIENAADFNRIAIEGVQKALTDELVQAMKGVNQ